MAEEGLRARDGAIPGADVEEAGIRTMVVVAAWLGVGGGVAGDVHVGGYGDVLFGGEFVDL